MMSAARPLAPLEHAPMHRERFVVAMDMRQRACEIGAGVDEIGMIVAERRALQLEHALELGKRFGGAAALHQPPCEVRERNAGFVAVAAEDMLGHGERAFEVAQAFLPLS